MQTDKPFKTKYSSVDTNDDATLQRAVNEAYEAVIEEEDDIDEDAMWLREQRHLNKGLHWLQRPLMLMVGFSLFLTAFATSSAESSRQMIQFKLACNLVLQRSGDDLCNSTDTQILVLNLQQAYLIAGAITTLFALGKVGPLSDQYGRKVFMVIIVALQWTGKFLRYLVMSKFSVLHLNLMILTEVLANLCGGVLTLVTLTNCYVSDISEAHERIYYLGINIACLFVGLSTGPLAGNLLLSLTEKAHKVSVTSTVSSILGLPFAGKVGIESTTVSLITREEFYPLRVELVLLGLGLLFTIFILPESRSEKARRKSRSLSRSLLVASFNDMEPARVNRVFQMFNFLSPLRLISYPADMVGHLRLANIDTHRTVVLILVVVDCLLTTIGMPLGEIYVLYGIYRYNWTAQNVGQLLAVSCSSRAFALIVVSPILTHKFFQGVLGLKVSKRGFDQVEYAMVITAFTCEILGLIMASWAPTGALFLGSLVLTSFGSLASPALNSAIVKFFPESKIGEVFGGIALVKNGLCIVSPIVVISIYKSSLKVWHLPQIVFCVVAVIYAMEIAAVTYTRLLLARVEEPEQGPSECSLAQGSIAPPQHRRSLSFASDTR